jgi:hypothetical protein
MMDVVDANKVKHVLIKYKNGKMVTIILAEEYELSVDVVVS